MFPYSWMLTSPLPKQKTLTPIGLALCNGKVRVSLDNRFPFQVGLDVRVTTGELGHTPGYTWTQGVFIEEERVVATVEAFSGFAKIAGRLMGPFSGMVVRTQDEEYRFDRLVDRWNHRVEQEPGIYNLQLKKGRLRASLSVSAKTENALCLGYDDPDGTQHFCWNSKLASSSLTIETPTQSQISEQFDDRLRMVILPETRNRDLDMSAQEPIAMLIKTPDGVELDLSIAYPESKPAKAMVVLAHAMMVDRRTFQNLGLSPHFLSKDTRSLSSTFEDVAQAHCEIGRMQTS